MTGALPYAQVAKRVHPVLLKAVNQMGYTHMSPVQAKVLTELPSLTNDCLVQAKTGTGKTLAFLLPTLQNLLTSDRKLARGAVGALTIAPTRELAQQIVNECDKLTAFCNPKLECHLAVGGSNKKSALTKFMKGNPSILVATPGRLKDYLSEPEVLAKFRDIRSVVLDEADTMLDQGFLEDIVKILDLLPSKKAAGWQGMCFSATMPAKMDKVLHHVLAPGTPRLSTIDPNEAPTIDRVPQAAIVVPGIEDATPALHDLLVREHALDPNLKAVVFSGTARHAGLMYQLFEVRGVTPGGLSLFQMHSRMSQPARNKTIEAFKKADRGLLFASDVVGRGMDFPAVSLVVQVGVPTNTDQYVHRVGRTGRAGKTGRANMILTPEEEFFVTSNKQFPIAKSNMDQAQIAALPSTKLISQAYGQVPAASREQAYAAMLGAMKGQGKMLKLRPVEIVALANRFAASMGFSQPPALDASTIGKMGFKGVAGLRKRPNQAGRQDDEGAPFKRRR